MASRCVHNYKYCELAMSSDEIHFTLIVKHLIQQFGAGDVIRGLLRNVIWVNEQLTKS